jgi:hypothetical protein
VHRADRCRGVWHAPAARSHTICAMPRLTVSAAAVVAVLVAAAPAAAQSTTPVPVPVPVPTPVPPPVPTVTTTTPAPPPAPVAVSGTIKLTLQKVGGRRLTVLAGTRWRVRGLVRPYVAGQKVIVRFYHGNHRLESKSLHVNPSSGGSVGRFELGFATKRTGTITVRASHRATSTMATILARSKSVFVMPTHLTPGATGTTVRVLQRHLAAMHFAVQVTGTYDQRTGRGVLALQKLTGLARTSAVDIHTMREVVAGTARFKVRFPGDGKHVEASLSQQVIALINPHGRVYRIYPVSSGKPSTPTVLGRFSVYEKSPGYNSEGMYYSSYFIRGYAIHGYDPSPNYAASHGCLRTWIPDAIAIYDWLQIGNRVDVYQ